MKVLRIVRFDAGEILSELLLHAWSAEYDFDVVDFDLFLFGFVDEFPTRIDRYGVAEFRSAIFDRLQRCRSFAQAFDHLVRRRRQLSGACGEWLRVLYMYRV